LHSSASHGFILYPGVPNTTAVTQETDQSYGPFQSAVRTNLQLIIDERIRTNAPRSLSPWNAGLVVFGGEDPETGLIAGSAFQRGFSHVSNIKAWEKVGTVPLSRKCLSSPKVRRSIGDGDADQQALVHLIVEHNTIACYALSLEGYNGDVMRVTLKPIERTTVITAAHTQERIELLSQAKAHGSIFLTTGGVHLTAKDIFKSNAFKHHKILREKLGKDKTLRDRQEKNKSVALDILQRKGENPTTMTGTDLTALLTWHQHPKVASLNKNAKFVAWMEIKRRGKAPPALNKWTHDDKEQLKEAQSNVVEMAHTALGHLEALKKNALLLAALLMTQEEFDKLAVKREKLVVELAALASNGNPLIFDDPNELIGGAAEIENNSDDASTDTSGGGEGFMEGEEGV